MRRSIRAALTGAVAIAAAAVGMGVPPASANAAVPATAEQAAQPGAAASPCGWYTDWMAGAWYNHCGTGHVVIHVDIVNLGGVPDYEKCVGPGDTYLGGWPNVQGAWYVGRTC